MAKVFMDNVHGHISLPPLCVKIVDTPEFQRLRDVKQLGLAYLVYPGATHTRFEHSLGVCHLAGQFVDRLRANQGKSGATITDSEKLCLQVAGLCHDLGHGPFSHMWERFVKTAKPDKRWKHEKTSTMMLKELIGRNHLEAEFELHGLGDEEIDFIGRLIVGDKRTDSDREKPYLFQIIANKENDIDVDKFDYFLRDALYLNASDAFDCQRLMASVRLVKVEGQWQVCYRDKDSFNVWNMFQVRARLHYQGYQHSVVKCLELMMLDALLAADKAGYQLTASNGKRFLLSEAHEDAGLWTRTTDHIFYELLFNTDEKFHESRAIIERITRRDLYHLVKKVRLLQDTTEARTKQAVKEFCSTNAALDEATFSYSVMKLDHGTATDDPFKNIYFYGKGSENSAEKMDIVDAQLFPATSINLQRKDLLVFYKKSKKTLKKDENDALSELCTFIEKLGKN